MLFGGSFDPVHAGHVAIAHYFCNRFHTTQLRLVPAGNPWQKPPLDTRAEQRADMLRLAFESSPLSVVIDMQETAHAGPSYTVDTLKAIREEVGNVASLVLVIGSDQLVNLNTWHEWKQLFDLAHIAVARRSESAIASSSVPADVREIFFSRLASPEEIRSTPHGLTYLAENPLMAVSSTEIRKNISHSGAYHSLVPPEVLDYIVKNNLYRD